MFLLSEFPLYFYSFVNKNIYKRLFLKGRLVFFMSEVKAPPTPALFQLRGRVKKVVRKQSLNKAWTTTSQVGSCCVAPHTLQHES